MRYRTFQRAVPCTAASPACAILVPTITAVELLLTDLRSASSHYHSLRYYLEHVGDRLTPRDISAPFLSRPTGFTPLRKYRYDLCRFSAFDSVPAVGISIYFTVPFRTVISANFRHSLAWNNRAPAFYWRIIAL